MFWDNYVNLCMSIGKKPNPVAEELKITSGTVTSWKRGSTPQPVTLKKIADYFNVSVEYLLKDHQKDTKKNIKKIPVYGQVAAGIPIEAIEDIADYEEIDEDNYPNGEYIALKIHGQSMEPRMVDGDVVIVRMQEDVDTGDTAVVIINGNEATCKKIKKTPEGVMLISTNPAFEPIFYSNKEIEELPIRILGKVIELRAKF